jgi:hypothetical protein
VVRPRAAARGMVSLRMSGRPARWRGGRLFCARWRWVMVRWLSGAVVVAAVVGASWGAERAVVTQAELLRRVADLERLYRAPAPDERTGMFSSYDRRSRINADGELVAWDANADAGNFLRTTDDGWQVMAELDGPGALTRIWSANPHGRLRIVLDGEVVVDEGFGGFMNREELRFMEQTGQQGATLYYPIGFSERCAVLLKEGQPYYQINFVQFAAGTRVERFALDAVEKHTAVRAAVAAALRAGALARDEGAALDEAVVETPAGWAVDAVERLELEGGGVVRALTVEIGSHYERPVGPFGLHRVVLRVLADGREEPLVEAPLVDFLGSGYGPRAYRSRVAAVAHEPAVLTRRFAAPTGHEFCDHPSHAENETHEHDHEVVEPGHAAPDTLLGRVVWPMPFRERLRVELVNRGERALPVGLRLTAAYEAPRPTEAVLYFQARYRVLSPAAVLDVPVLRATGPGRVVGLLLNIDCPRAEWWGEGDEKVWVDGERFPRYFGTGTEDLFNDAWGLRTHTHGLHGVTRAAAFGKASMYRWLTGDAITFHEDIRFGLENWQHGRQWDTHYGTLVYWYGPADSVAPGLFPSLTREMLTPPGRRVPDAIEIERNSAIIHDQSYIVRAQDTGDRLSNDMGVYYRADYPLPIAINIPTETRRVGRLVLRVSPSTPFETLTVRRSGGRTIGTARYDPANRDGFYELGVIELTPRDNAVEVDVDQDVLLDCWRLLPVRKIAGGVEGEDLELVNEAVDSEVEWATLDWSGAGQVRLLVPAGEVARLRLKPLPARSLEATLYLTAGPEGGAFQVLLDGTAVGEVIETRAAERGIVERGLPVRAFDGDEGELAFKNVGTRAAMVELDAVRLVPVVSAHAVELELAEVLASNVEDFGFQPIDGASRGAHLWCRATEVGARVTLAIPVERAGRYRVGAVLTESFDYGVVQLRLNGAALGEPVDTFGELQAGAVREFGVVTLPAGMAKLTAEVVGRNPESPGYYFGLDCLVLEWVGK